MAEDVTAERARTGRGAIVQGDRVGVAARLFLYALLIYVTATGLIEAMNRPFWYDEVFTVVLARLRSMADVLGALSRAADTSGPGFYVVERAVAPLVADPEVGFRLASVGAISLTSLFLFFFARPDVGAAGALIAATVPLLTLLYHGYSIEARPYALAVGCLSLAALAWRRASSRGWAVVFAAALAVAVSVNYHAIFAFIPFGLAEIVRSVRTRSVRVSAFVALGAGALPLLLFWANLSGLREYYGDHYWTTGTLADAVAGYDWFVGFRQTPGRGIYVASALTAVLLAFAVRPRWFQRDAPARITPEVVVFILTTMLLPFLVTSVGALAGGGFTPRYGVAVVIALALAAAYSACLLGRRSAAVACVGVLAALTAREIGFWRTGEPTETLTQVDLDRHFALLSRATDPRLPVVVSNGLHFVPLAFYEDDAETSPLVALVDFEGARKYSGTDSVERDLAVLRDYMAVDVRDYEDFAPTHSRYYLYSSSGRADWWPRRLRADGFKLEVVAKDGNRTLYLVTRGAPPPARPRPSDPARRVPPAT